MASFHFSSLAIACVVLGVPTAYSSSSQAQNTANDFLDPHNVARAQVGVPPLIWDTKLEAFAQEYANKAMESGSFTNSSGGPYGENTAQGYGAFNPYTAVSGWVDEKPNYDHRSNSCVEGTRCEDYTQVVWRNSTRVGCVILVSDAGWPFVACEYDPPGNIKGQVPY